MLPDQMPESAPWLKRSWLPATLMALVLLAAWGGALQAWFANDDFLWLDNSRLKPVIESFYGLAGVLKAFRPITRVSFLLDWSLFGADPLGWHLVNLLLHFACVWLGWRLIRQWLGDSIALTAALLFAAAPVLQENVVWISGRTASLSGMFGLISLLSFLRYGRALRARWLVLCVLADLAAFASYEPMIILPAAHLLIGWRARLPKKALISLLLAHGILFLYRDHVLAGQVSYKFRQLNGAGWRALVADYRPYVVQLLVRPIWWLPVLVAGVLPRNRDLLRAAGWVLLGVLISLLPYMVFLNAASRFFYLPALGFAVLFAILLRGLARLLPPRWGMAVMWLGCAAMLWREIPLARGKTDDWVAAGEVGRATLNAIVAAEPAPTQQGLTIVVDLPILVGNGELFFTYPGPAARRFTHLDYGALLGGHQLLFKQGKDEIVFLQKLIGEENDSWVRQGKPPLSCLQDRLSLSQSPRDFLMRAEDCGLVTLRMENGVARPMSREEFFAWLPG